MCQLNKPTLKNTTHNSNEGRFLLKAGCQTQPNYFNTVEAVTRSMEPARNGLIEFLSSVAFSALFLAFFF